MDLNLVGKSINSHLDLSFLFSLGLLLRFRRASISFAQESLERKGNAVNSWMEATRLARIFMGIVDHLYFLSFIHH